MLRILLEACRIEFVRDPRSLFFLCIHHYHAGANAVAGQNAQQLIEILALRGKYGGFAGKLGQDLTCNVHCLCVYVRQNSKGKIESAKAILEEEERFDKSHSSVGSIPEICHMLLSQRHTERFMFMHFR